MNNILFAMSSDDIIRITLACGSGYVFPPLQLTKNKADSVIVLIV